ENDEHERTDAMNNRERFRKIMNYEPVDRLKGRWSRKTRSTWSKRRIWERSCVCFDFNLEVKSKLKFRLLFS
ncbi:MAG: hypothetical protein ACE5PV_28010, partial [Candidatus Poribacteria bacterium]